MTTWKIADARGCDCAYGCKVLAGQPYQIVWLPGVQQSRRRCEAHALGPVPEGLETSSHVEPAVASFTPMRAFVLPKTLRDARQRQAGSE